MCKDLSWFISYNAVQTEVKSLDTGVLVKAVGRGTVELPVLLQDDKRQVLKPSDVLHIPGATCNIIASWDGLVIETRRVDGSNPDLFLSDGKPVA